MPTIDRVPDGRPEPVTDTPLRVCIFSGASALPMMVADHRGLFAAAGLPVDLTLTRSSDELMRGLLEGRLDIVHAAPDNFVAWRDRTGADVLAWLGGASGRVRLVARAGIERVADLAGQPIAVDAVTSGFVSVLRKILRAGGVDETETDLVELGSTDLRFAALRDGRVQATMLTVPYSVQALAEGFRSVGEQSEVMPRLQGSCAGSLGSWLTAHPDVADAYVRAITASLTWLYDPANEGATVAFLEEHFGLATQHARATRLEIVDPVGGWIPSAMIDPVGIQTLCDLRRENGMAPASAPETYYTFEPYRRVFGFGVL